MKKKFVACLLSLVCMFSIFCFSGCNEEISYHSVLATSSNERNGIVSGSGVYKTGETINLIATPKGDSTFIAWAKDDIVVSKDADYSFVVSGDENLHYTALFSTSTLDYMIFKSSFYNISGLEMETLLPTKMLSTTLSSSQYSVLYTPIATASELEIPNTGNFNCEDFSTTNKIFYLNRTYYFTFNINIEYTNIETSLTSTREYSTNFMINFADINKGVTIGNITTYASNEVSMTLTKSKDGNNLDIEFLNLGVPLYWNSATTQSLLLSFTYPFDLEENIEEPSI